MTTMRYTNNFLLRGFLESIQLTENSLIVTLCIKLKGDKNARRSYITAKFLEKRLIDEFSKAFNVNARLELRGYVQISKPHLKPTLIITEYTLLPYTTLVDAYFAGQPLALKDENIVLISGTIASEAPFSYNEKVISQMIKTGYGEHIYYLPLVGFNNVRERLKTVKTGDQIRAICFVKDYVDYNKEVVQNLVIRTFDFKKTD